MIVFVKQKFVEAAELIIAKNVEFVECGHDASPGIQTFYINAISVKATMEVWAHLTESRGDMNDARGWWRWRFDVFG